MSIFLDLLYIFHQILENLLLIFFVFIICLSWLKLSNPNIYLSIKFKSLKKFKELSKRLILLLCYATY